MDDRLVPYLADCARENRTVLTERESKSLLGTFGIPVVEEAAAASPDDAVDLADSFGYPVVLKGSIPAITHKSDADLVALSLESETAVREAFDRITNRLADATDATDSGEVLVQPHVDGEETIVGMHADEQFGPVVMFGLGGIFVELFDDVTFRLPPIDGAEAGAMIAETKAASVLDGLRGRPRRDVAALRDVIVSFSAFCRATDPHVVEVDINPLVVFDAGDGAVAVDALVRFDPDAVRAVE